MFLKLRLENLNDRHLGGLCLCRKLGHDGLKIIVLIIGEVFE